MNFNIDLKNIDLKNISLEDIQTKLKGSHGGEILVCKRK